MLIGMLTTLQRYMGNFSRTLSVVLGGKALLAILGENTGTGGVSAGLIGVCAGAGGVSAGRTGRESCAWVDTVDGTAWGLSPSDLSFISI